VSAISSASSVSEAHVGLDRVLADLTAEREAQHAVHGVQHHLPDGTDPQWAQLADNARRECEQAAAAGRLTWRHILLDEVAEALAEDDPDRLRRELVKVVAVGAQWLQAIDNRSLSAVAEESRHGRHD
jgi:hypothetical protein